MKKTQPKPETPPAAAAVSVPQPAPEVPDWANNTPYETLYTIEMWQQEIVETVDMTRAEYIALKQHLAAMRGIAPAPPPEEPAAATGNVDLAADFAEIEEANHGSDTPAENFITHLVMVSHFRPLTPDEAADCLETFRDDFDCMVEATRTFVARYP